MRHTGIRHTGIRHTGMRHTGFFFPMCSRTYDTMKHGEMHKKLVCFKQKYWYLQGFPGGSVGEESACHVGNLALIPGSGRSPRKGNGNPCQYSCLENSVDTGARRATGHGVAESGTVRHSWAWHFLPSHCHCGVTWAVTRTVFHSFKEII